MFPWSDNERKGFLTAFLLVGVLIGLLPGVNALNEGAAGDIDIINDIVYFAVSNPNQSIVNTSCFLNNNRIAFNSSANKTIYWNTGTLGQGVYLCNISENGILVRQETLTAGTLLDTGFKDTMEDATGGNWGPLAVFVLLGFAVSAASLGQYAGYTIISSIIVVMAAYSYIPTWPIFIILFVLIYLFARGVYNALGAGG